MIGMSFYPSMDLIRSFLGCKGIPREKVVFLTLFYFLNVQKMDDFLLTSDSKSLKYIYIQEQQL